MMEWYYGSDTINMLRSLVENMPAYDKLIGYYTYTWGPDENWGIGQHSNLGTDGLRIWYSIWSDTDPGPVSQPNVSNPDVTIASVTVPATIQRSSYFMVRHTLRIQNNEECPIYIDWKAHSSVAGDFDSGTAVVVPANGYIDINKDYSYSSNAVGPVELTYTISHEGVVLDTKSVSTVVQ
jgi:hypothetical protein